MHDDLRLASLVSSRICHDLISPVGAIGNGLELLAMSGASDGEELQLINDSARDAAATLRFLRIAYGAASSAERHACADLAAIMRDHLTTARLTVAWKAPGDSLSRETARIALLAAATASSALPFGGAVTVERAEETPIRVEIRFEGERARLDDASRAILQGALPAEEADPRQAHFALLKSHADSMAYALDVTIGPDGGRVLFG